jgi:hypothetical protein
LDENDKMPTHLLPGVREVVRGVTRARLVSGWHLPTEHQEMKLTWLRGNRLLYSLFVVVLVWLSCMQMSSESAGDCETTMPSQSILQDCPMQLAISWDVGRLGNQFFEFLAARVISDALGIGLFIPSDFAQVYDRYFNGRQTPVVDWTYLQNKCDIFKPNCKSISIDYAPDGSENKLFYPCITFKG